MDAGDVRMSVPSPGQGRRRRWIALLYWAGCPACDRIGSSTTSRGQLRIGWRHKPSGRTQGNIAQCILQRMAKSEAGVASG